MGLAAHAVILHHGLGQVAGNGQGIAAVNVHGIFLGKPLELGFIADLVTRRLARSDGRQDFHQVSAVVRMGGGPGRDHAAQVAGNDDVGIGPAHAELGAFAKGIHPAGAHDADAATQPHITKTALGLLGLVALPNGFDIVLCGLLQKWRPSSVTVRFDVGSNIQTSLVECCWMADVIFRGGFQTM